MFCKWNTLGGREQSKVATGEKEAVRLEDVGGVEPPEEIREEPQSRCVLQPSGLSICLFCSAGEGSLGLTHVGEGSATELHVRRQDYYSWRKEKEGT